MNCASIPRDLLESEFFGHVRGAFTGALRDRVGRFALADGGTIFLDEVGEIPLELQSKLLRVLQEGEYERLGDDRTRRTDARIIAATNRDLRRDVDDGRFREDLFYRLNAFPVAIPPLRERREDIVPLTVYLVRATARKMNREVPRVPASVLAALESHDWAGNVRELQNVIEHALIASRGRRLAIELPGSGTGTSPAQPAPGDDAVLTDAEIRRLERENVRRALRRANGRVYGPDGAAELLGLKPTTLTSRIRKMGLDRRGGDA